MLQTESVLKSSDVMGWHNLRALHFRHTERELTIPASDDHCMVLNLGAAVLANVYPGVYHGKRRFEGRIGSSEVAIIPAGSSWTCRSEGSELPAMLLIYLRPLFVRSAARELSLSHSEIGLTPQIGFRDKHISHVAMSLLHELNEANVVGRLYADSLAMGLAIQFYDQPLGGTEEVRNPAPDHRLPTELVPGQARVTQSHPQAPLRFGGLAPHLRGALEHDRAGDCTTPKPLL